jgi:hypothetical protein
MAQLTNLKHEQFCRKLIEAAKRGLSQGWAYQQSGYHCETAAADVAACRLLKSAKIQARLTELTAPATRKAAFTAAEAHEKLSAVFEGAVRTEQFGAARGAIETQSKIAGLMIDRVEIGEAGEFAGCDTAEKIVDKWLETDDPAGTLAFLDELRAMVIERAGDQALLISPDVGVRVGIEPRWRRESQ